MHTKEVTYIDPHELKKHSKLNRLFSRWFYRLIYIWNKYVIRRKIYKIEPWISMSYGRVEHNNWGDDINMFFISKISLDCVLPGHAYAHPYTITFKGLAGKTPIYTIGSVLHLIEQKDSIVWGSGLLNETYIPSVEALDIRAVRGPLTRKALLKHGYQCPEVYGDPALLLPLYYMPRDVKKKYKLGIVPHYVDIAKEELEKFKKVKSVLIISMSGYRNWRDVINEILSCEYVVSSSLHGLIVAEAYNVPNLWVEIREPIVGDMSRRFKYHDFFQSIGMDREEPYCITNATTLNDLLNQIRKYKKAPGIDLKTLVDACPFQIIETIQKSL